MCATLALIPSLIVAILIARHSPQHRPIVLMIGIALVIDSARWAIGKPEVDMGLALVLPVVSAVVYWRVWR